MASLKKRGRYYYITFTQTLDGERLCSTKSLGVTYLHQAEEAQEQLEEMEEEGEINPYSSDFDPQKALEQKADQEKNRQRIRRINTVRKAADYFYRKKSHLSDKTVKNNSSSDMNHQGAYERAVELFISINDIEDLNPRRISIEDFEAVIFRPNLASATRHFYFRQLRVWWNVLLKKGIVQSDFFEELKGDLPPVKTSTRPKMLSELELNKLFKAFDDELAKKRKNKHWVEKQAQHWFKPVVCCYFYGGLRKNEAAFDPDLEYSGLKGKTCIMKGTSWK